MNKGKSMTEAFGNSVNPPGEYSERRSVPRFSLIATAEIIEPASGVHISGRISEISRKGCYLDVLNTLPIGTRLRLDISRDQGTFSTESKIIYIQEGMGMGIAFLNVLPDQLKILDAWLVDLAS
ncbi:MAG: PilZ domain-containing protein [Candidatus Acidiferrales bacterium]